MRILVIEDDAGTGDYLKKGLTEAGAGTRLRRYHSGCDVTGPQWLADY